MDEGPSICYTIDSVGWPQTENTNVVLGHRREDGATRTHLCGNDLNDEDAKGYPSSSCFIAFKIGNLHLPRRYLESEVEHDCGTTSCR